MKNLSFSESLMILFFSLLISTAAFAQSKDQSAIIASGDTLSLSLQQSLQLALEYNHDLRIAKLNDYIAEQRLRESWGSAIFPELNATVSYNRALKRGVFTIETPAFSGTFPMGTENTLSTGFTLTQTLFSGSAFVAIKAAEVYKSLTDQQFIATKTQVIGDVKKAYFAVLFAKQNVELSMISLELAEQALRDAKALFDAGLVAEFDYVRAKTRVQSIIPMVTEAENAYQIALSGLKLACGIDLQQPVKASDLLAYQELVDGDYLDFLSQLKQSNPTLKQIEMEIELRDKNITNQFSKHLPELSASGQWNVEAQENDDRSFGRWRFNNSVYVGVNMRVPIFNGWQTSARVEQAELEKKIAEENLVKTSRLLSQQLQQTLFTIGAQREKIEAYKVSIDENELAYRMAVSQYKNGLGTQLEITDAIVSLTQARVNYYSGIYNYLIGVTTLENLIGKEILQ